MIIENGCKKTSVTKERMLTPVQVHPIIREFIIDTNGSDVIVPEKNSLFWKTIKYNLEIPPEDYREPQTKDNIIYIALIDSTGTKSVSKKTDNTIYINHLFRWYLSHEAQEEIASYLRKQFKHTFHCYIQGAVSNNPNIEQRHAIENFCKMYHLTMNELSEDMLKKSWYRSDHKQMVEKRKFICCPLFF
jgi:hypothetical protein